MPSKTNATKLQTPRRSTRLATINSSLRRTKDNIIIFKVFVSFKNKNITKEALMEKFSSFGKIKYCKIIKNQRKETTFKCTYYDPKSATRSLRSNFIQLNNKNIAIKYCPTWEQPHQVTDYFEKTASNKTLNTPEPVCNIFTLNDDCLAILFKFLDFKTQLQFSLCHEGLEDIYEKRICPRLIPKQLTVDEWCIGKLSNLDLWQFFKTTGQYIYGIKFSSYWNMNVLKMIEEFCTNLQRVQLIYIENIKKNKIWRFINISILTEIELHGCDLIDGDIKVLEFCCNLTSMGLGENIRLFGEVLQYLNKLQRLSVYRCDLLKMDNLIGVCKKCNLKSLDITSPYKKISRSEILKYCPDLETLKLSVTSDKDLENIMILENLKSLKLHFHHITSPLTLTTLLNKLHNKLETLKLFNCDKNILPNCVGGTSFSVRTLWITMCCSNSINLEMGQFFSTLKELEEINLSRTNDLKHNDLLSVVKNCRKLKRIYLYKPEMTKDFLYSCSDHLDKCGYTNPLTIFLMGTDIYEFRSIQENIVPNINKMLILKRYPYYYLNGLLSDDLPIPHIVPCK